MKARYDLGHGRNIQEQYVYKYLPGECPPLVPTQAGSFTFQSLRPDCTCKSALRVRCRRTKPLFSTSVSRPRSVSLATTNQVRSISTARIDLFGDETLKDC